MNPVTRLIRMAADYKWWMLLAALLGFLTVGSSIGLLMTSAYIISKAALHPSISELQVGIVGVRFFGISRGLFRYLERLVTHDTTFKLLTRFRVWFFEALEPLAPARLQKYKSADLLNRIVSDVQTLEHFFVRVLAPPMVAVGISLLMWILLRVYDPVFGITILLFHALAGLAVPALSYLWAQGTGEAILKLRADLNVLILDQIQGMAELTVFNGQDSHRKQINEVNRKLDRLEQKMTRISALHEALIGLLMNAAVLTMLVFAIPLVQQNTLDGVYLAVIVLGVMASFEALLPLPEALQFLEKNSRAAGRLFEMVDATPEVREPDVPEALPDSADFAIKELTFRYEPNATPTLQDISLSIPAGSRIAIVGPSGAGKSTLIQLLLRFREYHTGSIQLGSVELKKMDSEQVRKQMAVVSQSTFLFDSTVRENLLLAKPQAEEQDLTQALQAADLWNFVSGLEQGLEAEVGAHGQKWSGGQRQRLAIARAVLKEAPVLLLDEATSGLDAFTEQAVLETILTRLSGITIIHITHRLVMMDRFEQIVVLCKGRIIQQGTHKSLLQKEGFYKEMWQLQRQQDMLAN